MMNIYLLRDVADETTKEELESAFSKFGSVISVQIHTPSLNPSNRIAIIKMARVHGESFEKECSADHEIRRGMLRLVKRGDPRSGEKREARNVFTAAWNRFLQMLKG